MNKNQISALAYKPRYFLITTALVLMSLTALWGCTANYGQYKRSYDVAKMFESLQIPDDYRYYYAGSDKNPDALMGLQRDYRLNNDLWKETDMDREQLRKWLDEISLVGYYSFVFGQYILDPSGKVIGIYYSKYDGGPVKMESDNQVVIHLPDIDRSKRPMLMMKLDIDR